MDGKIVCETLEEIREATTNLDTAKLCPLKIDDGGVVKDVDNYKGVYNVSQGKFCTSVINHYTLVQHKDYFDTFAEAVSKLGIEFNMIIKSVGNRAFADINFEGRNLKFDKLDEEFTTGIRLVNSYDKTSGLSVMPRFTRLACENGMILTRSEKTVSAKHISKAIRDIGPFIETKINEIINQHSDLQGWVSSSMKDSAEWRVCCGIVEKLFSQIKHREEILKNLGVSIIQIEDKKAKIKKKQIQYVLDKKDGKQKFTRWEVYNAVTRYLTHGEHITPHIENLFHHKAEMLLNKSLEEMPKIEVKI